MKKQKIRKEFFKLKSKGHSYNQCRKILKATFDYDVHNRTLQRWMYNLDYNDKWNLKDKSTKPKIIHRKISKETEEKIISIKKDRKSVV